jgi:hypothetical protein
VIYRLIVLFSKV